MESGGVAVATDVRSCESWPGVIGMACDVRSESSVRAVVAECERQGGLDVLVNAAGIMRRADVLEMGAEEWSEVFDVNLRGAYLCSQGAARSMIARARGGSIVHIGSVNAEKVFGDSVAYCSSKGALHALGRSMALGLASHRIRVNIVAPGAIHDTDLEPQRWAREEERSGMTGRTPLRSLGTSADVAAVVMFLASDAARFITGATIFVDGGRTATV